MSFEIWIIISVLAGVLTGILAYVLSDRLFRRRDRMSDPKYRRRMALTEGLLWISPILNYLQQCILLTEDYSQRKVSRNGIKELWPELELKAIEQGPGREVLVYLPEWLYLFGMQIISKLENKKKSFPEAIVVLDPEHADDHEMLHQYLANFRQLLAEFQKLDSEVRQLFLK